MFVVNRIAVSIVTNNFVAILINNLVLYMFRTNEKSDIAKLFASYQTLEHHGQK